MLTLPPEHCGTSGAIDALVEVTNALMQYCGCLQVGLQKADSMKVQHAGPVDAKTSTGMGRCSGEQCC